MAMNISKKPLFICLLLAAIIASACSGMNHSDRPATTTWWLNAYGEAAVVPSPDSRVKVDVAVTVVPGLDTHRILTLADNAEMNKYAAARWADSLPELTASLVSRSLEATGRFAVVSRAKGVEECDLLLEVQEFYARLDSAGRTTGVQVGMQGRYLCDRQEPVLIRLRASKPVHEERMSVIVAAFQRAMDEIMKDLIGII